MLLKERTWQLARFIGQSELCPQGRLFWLIARRPRLTWCACHGVSLAYRSSYSLNGPRPGYFGLVHAGDIELLPTFVTAVVPADPLADDFVNGKGAR